MYLSTITENDYREYRKCFTKVKYSITKKGEPLSYPMGLLHDSYMNVILGKGDFLDVVKNPQNSLFFYKDDTDETIGIVFLTFKGKICTIAEFSVFDHLRVMELSYTKKLPIFVVRKASMISNFGAHSKELKSSGKRWDFMKKEILTFIVESPNTEIK